MPTATMSQAYALQWQAPALQPALTSLTYSGRLWQPLAAAAEVPRPRLRHVEMTLQTPADDGDYTDLFGQLMRALPSRSRLDAQACASVSHRRALPLQTLLCTRMALGS